MELKNNVRIYIDASNLYEGFRALNYRTINYKKFYGWLIQKYGTRNIFLFIGFLLKNKDLYENFAQLGFYLIFKEAVITSNGIKGNCDVELTLKVVKDIYEEDVEKVIIITSDGDFVSLADFLNEKKIGVEFISPNRKECSFLIRKREDIKLLFLDDHYHKFKK